MKITIDTMEDNNIELVKLPIIDSEIAKESKIKKSTKRAHRVHYAVASEDLLYKLADAGLLQKMHGVNFIDGKNIWFFSKDDDVKAVIDKYKADNALKNKLL